MVRRLLNHEFFRLKVACEKRLVVWLESSLSFECLATSMNCSSSRVKLYALWDMGSTLITFDYLSLVFIYRSTSRSYKPNTKYLLKKCPYSASPLTFKQMKMVSWRRPTTIKNKKCGCFNEIENSSTNCFPRGRRFHRLSAL